jgi:hypothetical protein
MGFWKVSLRDWEVRGGFLEEVIVALALENQLSINQVKD